LHQYAAKPGTIGGSGDGNLNTPSC